MLQHGAYKIISFLAMTQGVWFISSCSHPLQSLIFLGCVAAAGLGLNLLCLAIYLSCLCCCRKEEEEESKKPNSCCVTWSAVAAGLITWWENHDSDSVLCITVITVRTRSPLLSAVLCFPIFFICCSVFLIQSCKCCDVFTAHSLFPH